MTVSWRDVPDEDPTDDDEDVPCPGYVLATLGFDPDEQDWGAVANAGNEDEPRDPAGRWTSGGDIPAALRPKLRDGLYPKSAELHEAAADPAKLEALFKRVAPKERGKLTRLVEQLKGAKDAQTHQNKVVDEVKPVDADAVHETLKALTGSANLAPLPKVRAALAHLSHEEQDAALLELHKQGKIGFSGWEGRSGIKPEERAALLDVGGQKMGHVYLRGGPVGNTFCPTGEGGGVDPSCGGAAHPSSSAGQEALADASPPVKAVLGRMAAGAAARIASHVGKLTQLPLEELQRYDIERIGPTDEGGTVLGFCVPWGAAQVEVALASDDPDAEGTAAHELGHALDGRTRVLSRQEDWKAAWKAEIDRPGEPLSAYARESLKEGFAEFARLLWTHADLRHAERHFPLCFACWKKRGLA